MLNPSAFKKATDAEPIKPTPPPPPPATPTSADIERLLFTSARRGDTDAVIGLVSTAPSLLHAREAPNGWTALHILARLSLAVAVKALLERGADPEIRDGTFRSALHMAASADSQPESGGPEGCAAPLTDAARPAAMIATLHALLKAGARVTARDSFGMTALHHAAHAGHKEAVLFLLSLNTELRLPRAPLEAETNAEERPIHLAAAGGHTSTVTSPLSNTHSRPIKC